ncbi:DUF292-domain-containing protein [Polychaeton citri CBS 116435]|uniref:DUF292-domain-containing protein n=1 Tax=Polychaeton citri CBS 116435 TaxID=1314669 RepID=A0A9P4QFX8_9PEZI|nr:DUF292-domain-containing protein [Polychaeton citri CBS 116435]
MAPSSSLVNKIKVQLKLSISRLRMVQQKDEALAKQQRRAMVQLLEVGKEESARIRVENIIRSDLNTELLEILELYCELLYARVGLLEAKECDSGLEEAVKSIIYAAPKIEGVKELSTVRALLGEKYGKDFVVDAMANTDEKVSERVTSKLKVEPPKKELVQQYLETIADAYGIDWPPGTFARRKAEAEAEAEAAEEGGSDDDDGEGGQKIKLADQPVGAEEMASPPTDLGPKSPVSVAPPRPTSDNMSPKVNLPKQQPLNLKPSTKMTDAGKKSDGGPGGKIPDVDELSKRFAQLKR